MARGKWRHLGSAFVWSCVSVSTWTKLEKQGEPGAGRVICSDKKQLFTLPLTGCGLHSGGLRLDAYVNGADVGLFRLTELNERSPLFKKLSEPDLETRIATQPCP